MKYTKSEIIDSIERVNNFITKNKKAPKTVRVGKDTLKWLTWKELEPVKDMQNRIQKFINKNKTYPNYVTYANSKMMKEEYKYIWAFDKTELPRTTGDKIVDKFIKTFGKFKTFDDALRLVNNKGYSYYYDDVYTNSTSIDRIKSKKGINCTDSCQLFYHIAKYLNYKVDVLHVQCVSGGHVRLKLTKNGKTYYRDPASVLNDNGKPIANNWCANAPLIAVNPQWFMNGVNR